MASLPNRPQGSNTINPYFITNGAAALIDFLVEVFGALDVPEARTLDTDGLILHAELRIGDSLLTIADRKTDWPFTPGFVSVYVDDVGATLASAERLGGRIVTRPTDFFGHEMGRFADPSGNLWWVYLHDPSVSADTWSDDSEEGQDWPPGEAGEGGAEEWSSFSTPELEYIHSTLVEAMTSLQDPTAT